MYGYQASEFNKLDRVTQEKLKRGWQWVGDKSGMKLVPPNRAHDLGRGMGLKGRDISRKDKPFGLTDAEFKGGMVQRKFGKGGVSLDHDYTHMKDNPFQSDADRAEHDNYVKTKLGSESMRVNQTGNFADRVGRAKKFNPQMNKGTVAVAKNQTNFDQPTTQRIGNIPTPGTDRAMRDLEKLPKNKQLEVINSFKRHRGEAPLVA